jgi:hypothetical protein
MLLNPAAPGHPPAAGHSPGHRRGGSRSARSGSARSRSRVGRGAHGFVLTAAVIAFLVPAVISGQSPWGYDHDLRVSYEFDDNVQEQPDDPVRAQVAKLGYHGDLLWGGGDEQRLTISYQGGFKRHFGAIQRELEDRVPSQFVNEGSVAYLRKVTSWLALGGRLGVKHRAWTDSLFFINEDGFTQRSGGLNAILDLEPMTPEQSAQFEIGVEWTDSKFKHLDRPFGSHGIGGFAKLTKHFSEDVEASASYAFDRVRFPGRKTLEPGDLPQNILAPFGERQEDDLHELGAAIRWFGPVSVVADYRFRYNDSNSFGFSYVSHNLGIQMLRPLPWDMLAHVVGQVELRTFLEPVPRVTAGSLDTDDAQNNVLLLRLVKDITQDYSIEARYARYRNEAITLNDFYSKNIWAVGVTYRP